MATSVEYSGRVRIVNGCGNLSHHIWEQFIFSDTTVGWNSYIVTAPDSNDSISFGDVDACKTLRFGALIGDAVTPNFIVWCAYNGFEPNISYYHD